MKYYAFSGVCVVKDPHLSSIHANELVYSL